MADEYEIVRHSQIQDLNIFLVSLTHRSPHMHKEFEICLVLSGSLEVYTNKNVKNYDKGSVLIFNPYQTHELHSLTENTLLVSVQIASGFCKRIYPEISLLKFGEVLYTGDESRGFTQKKMQQMLIDLCRIYLKEESGYEFYCMASLYELFGNLMHSHMWHTITEQERAEQYNKAKRLQRITDYIDSHFTEKILLTDIAEQEKLSLYYLSHLFKDMLGLSFQEYVALQRFERARRLVEHTDKSLTEIGYECGFSDYRYLNKIYLSQLGYTPADFRRSHMITEVKEEQHVTDSQIFLDRRESLMLLDLAAERLH